MGRSPVSRCGFFRPPSAAAAAAAAAGWIVPRFPVAVLVSRPTSSWRRRGRLVREWHDGCYNLDKKPSDYDRVTLVVCELGMLSGCRMPSSNATISPPHAKTPRRRKIPRKTLHKLPVIADWLPQLRGLIVSKKNCGSRLRKRLLLHKPSSTFNTSGQRDKAESRQAGNLKTSCREREDGQSEMSNTREQRIPLCNVKNERRSGSPWGGGFGVGEGGAQTSLAQIQADTW